MTNNLKDNIYILCVEDDDVNQMLLKITLQKLGFKNVTIARNGKEALDIIENSNTQCDLIIMDLGLPDMSGIQVTEKIRISEGKYKNIPIIALTGDDSSEAKKNCFAVGMNGFLNKPLVIEMLNSALEEILFKQ